MRRSLVLCALVATVLVLVGCPNPTTDNGDGNGSGIDQPAGVYVAGWYHNGTSEVAAYWVDETRTDLSIPTGATDARATDIFVDDSGVYVSGWYVSSADDTVAAYWKDGARSDLSDPGEDVEATSIFVETGVVYVSGTDTTGTPIPLYWRDGSREDLRAAAANAAATGITVSGGEVYVSGHYNNGTYPYAAVLWRDADPGVPLEEELFTTNITEANAVVLGGGGDLYVAGNFYDTNWASVYWSINRTSFAATSTELYDDPGGTLWSKGFGVDEAGGTVYTAGYYDSGAALIPACWTHATKTDLPGDTGGSGRALDIDVESGVVHVCGYTGSEGTATSVVWQDGAITELPDDGSPDSQAVAIFVVP